jgi:MAF protein
MSVPRQKRLVLASGSPRRREILAAFVPPVEAVSPTSKESPPRDGESPERYVMRLSLAKASEGAKHARQAIVLGADTSVVLDGELLGKPVGEADATRMLANLRGRTHRVVTGVVALDSESGLWSGSTRSTQVAMRHYSDTEVEAYVASGSPFDKAGAYAVQDSSFHPAESVDGCYLNVVGLPLCEVVALLDRRGLKTRLRSGWQPPAQCRECPLQHERRASSP